MPRLRLETKRRAPRAPAVLHCALALALLSLAACGDAGPSGLPREVPEARYARLLWSGSPPAGSEYAERWAANDSLDCLTERFFNPDSLDESGASTVHCPATARVEGAEGGALNLRHRADGNRQPISVRFTQPVGKIVILRKGDFPCGAVGGGSVRARGAGGQELEEATFVELPGCILLMPVLRALQAGGSSGRTAGLAAVRYEDGWPFVATWAEARVSASSGVSEVVIEPPGEWEWDGGNLGAQAVRLEYAIIYRTPESQDVTEIFVNCTPENPVRGTRVQCTARQSSGAEVPQAQWTFVSAGEGSTFSIPLFDVDPPQGTEWSGPLVVSGTVRVRALVDGRELRSEARVTARPRNWLSKQVGWTIEDVDMGLKLMPEGNEDLGRNEFSWRPRVTSISTVSEGPNAGLSYFSEPPFNLRIRVALNRRAMRPGSAFFLIQAPSTQNVDGIRFCSRLEMVRDTIGVKLHEGFVPFVVNSHSEVVIRSFSDSVRSSTEKMVFAESPSLLPLGDGAQAFAEAESYRVTHDPALNPYQPRCTFNFDPNRRFRR